MNGLAARAVYLLVALCLGLNGLAWAGHVDMPAPAASGTSLEAAHAHVEAGELVAGCDHCCHAGAHLVALVPEAGVAAPPHTACRLHGVTPSRADPVPEPPFIPPIA